LITVDEYLTQHTAQIPPEIPAEVRANAEILLPKVLALLADPECPLPDGGLRSGYRPAWYNKTVPTAAPNSKHMTGQAIDLNDDDGLLDNWLTDEILQQYDLWREHPASTKSWCHLQCVPPKSGNRTFYP